MRKGFTESTVPDMLVHMAALFHYEESVPTARDYYSYGGVFRPYAWGNGMGVTAYSTYDVHSYIDGSLIINIADAETQRLLWEGIGNKQIYHETVDPVSQIPEASMMVRVFFFPAIILSGFYLWKGQALKKWLRSKYNPGSRLQKANGRG